MQIIAKNVYYALSIDELAYWIAPSDFIDKDFFANYIEYETTSENIFNYLNDLPTESLSHFFEINSNIWLVEDINFKINNIRVLEPYSEESNYVTNLTNGMYTNNDYIFINLDINLGEYNNYFDLCNKSKSTDDFYFEKFDLINFAIPDYFVRETQQLKNIISSVLIGIDRNKLNKIRNNFINKDLKTEDLDLFNEQQVKILNTYNKSFLGTAMIITILDNFINHTFINKNEILNHLIEVFDYRYFYSGELCFVKDFTKIVN